MECVMRRRTSCGSTQVNFGAELLLLPPPPPPPLPPSSCNEAAATWQRRWPFSRAMCGRGGRADGRASGGRRKRRRRWKFLHFLHTSDDPVGALAFSKDHKNKVLQGNKALRCTSTVRDRGHRVCFWAPNTWLRRKRSNNQSHNHKAKEKSPFQGKTNYGI